MNRLAVVLGAALIFCGGCACTNFDHMSTTNLLDRTIVPDNRVGHWLMTPLLVPICVTTLAVDNLIVAPIVHAPSAYMDSKDFFTADAGGYYTEMGVLPIRTALTPVVFAASWLGRSFFSDNPKHDAWWGWPEWGKLWERDQNGKLVGPRQTATRVAKPVE